MLPKELLSHMSRAYKFLTYLVLVCLMWALPSLGHAATVKRANVVGTLFLLELLEDEKFGNGDMVFIIIDGQLKTTGTLKIESEGSVYLKPKIPIMELKQGDEALISHDPIWLMSNQGKPQIVSGIVGSVSGGSVFIKMDERFQPVFALNQPVELQLEETLLVIPATAIEYRKTGIWFKITGDIEKLPSGTVVSFPHTQTAGRSITIVSRRLRQGTSSILYRFGRNALSIDDLARSDAGYVAGILGAHEIKSTKYFIMQLGAGVEYKNVKSSGTVSGANVDYGLTQFSAIFHAAPQYRIDDKSRAGLYGEVHYGLNGSANTNSKNESNSNNSQITSTVVGLTGAYSIGTNSMLGFFAGFSSEKVTITNDSGSDSYNGKGNSQILYFAKLF